jgi:hypothetical protein
LHVRAVPGAPFPIDRLVPKSRERCPAKLYPAVSGGEIRSGASWIL